MTVFLITGGVGGLPCDVTEENLDELKARGYTIN